MKFFLGMRKMGGSRGLKAEEDWSLNFEVEGRRVLKDLSLEWLGECSEVGEESVTKAVGV
jgi:hypothetical protein